MTVRKRSIRRRRFLKLGLAGAASALTRAALADNRPKDAPKRPNVLLIVSEDNGPELGCYGDKFAQTPALDRLAGEGVRFHNAYITNPVCSPSRSSIFTGLYPHQNGQIGLATHKYAMFRKWPNVVSLLKKGGYRTGVIGKIHVNPESAFPFGFRPNCSKYNTFSRRDVKRVAEVANGFMTQSADPFFLMVNYSDAHFPLIRQYAGLPIKPLEGKDVKTLPFVGADNPRLRGFTANYYNCLSRLDTGVGLLLGALRGAGKADNTLVMYVGDHGAQFSRGKTTLYEGGVRVPLILRRPGRIRPGTVRRELVSTIDILPTVLEAVGLKGPRNLPGRSLLPLGEGKTVAWREYVFTEKAGSAPFWTFPRRGVRDGRYKLIVSLLQDRENPMHDAYVTQQNAFFKAGTSAAEIASAPEPVRKGYATWKQGPPVELYDLRADPHEWANLAGRPEYADVQKRLLTALRDWQKKTRDPLTDPAKLKMLAEEMDQVVKQKIDYRRKKTFRWGYLEYLRDRRD